MTGIDRLLRAIVTATDNERANLKRTAISAVK